MRRDGSASFVVEVKRRRFPQQSATTSDLDRGWASRISPIGVGASSLTPRTGSDPTVEAAKIAAQSFFSKAGSSQSAGAERSDPAARGCISRVEPALAADVAADMVTFAPAQPAAQAEQPRSGRVLQSLIVEDPIDALLRQEDEERSTRRRPRGSRARGVAHEMSAKPSTGFMESAVSTDIVEPGRKLRGRTVVTDPNPDAGTPRGKTVKKTAAKAPGRTGSLRRAANESAGTRQRAQTRANIVSFDKKGTATRAAAKKGSGKAAVAKKTTVRKGEAKGSRGRSTLAKKRLAAKRTATALSGGKPATRKIGKTKTKKSPASTAKTSTRGARRNR